jgi:hypothetical protein
LSGDRISTAKIKRCYKVLKDVVYGRETDLWVFAGILLARLGVKEIGSECPICGRVFASPKGVYNHLLGGRCKDKFRDICIDVHRVFDYVIRVISLRGSRYVVGGVNMFKIYVRGFDSFSCRYRDVGCVADGFRKVFDEMRGSGLG